MFKKVLLNILVFSVLFFSSCTVYDKKEKELFLLKAGFIVFDDVPEVPRHGDLFLCINTSKQFHLIVIRNKAIISVVPLPLYLESLKIPKTKKGKELKREFSEKLKLWKKSQKNNS